MRNYYEYPPELYCVNCERRVKPVLEIRNEILVFREQEEKKVPYQAALCPLCGEVLCENDRDWALIRLEQERLD